jgi:hypothetical protein
MGESMCDLWWTKCHWNRFFSEFFGFPVTIISPWLSMFIYHWGMKNKPTDDCNSETISPHRYEQQQQNIKKIKRKTTGNKVCKV